MIAILFLLFIVKKITKRFTYRPSSIFFVFDMIRTVWCGTYDMGHSHVITLLNSISELPTAESDPQNFIYLVISSTILPAIAIMGTALDEPFYHRTSMRHRLWLIYFYSRFQPLKDCRSQKKNSYLKLFNSRRRSTMTQERWQFVNFLFDVDNRKLSSTEVSSSVGSSNGGC